MGLDCGNPHNMAIHPGLWRPMCSYRGVQQSHPPAWQSTRDDPHLDPHSPGDDGELRPWHYIHEGGKGRRGSPTMTLHIRRVKEARIVELDRPSVDPAAVLKVQGYLAHKKLPPPLGSP